MSDYVIFGTDFSAPGTLVGWSARGMMNWLEIFTPTTLTLTFPLQLLLFTFPQVREHWPIFFISLTRKVGDCHCCLLPGLNDGTNVIKENQPDLRPTFCTCSCRLILSINKHGCHCESQHPILQAIVVHKQPNQTHVTCFLKEETAGGW